MAGQDQRNIYTFFETITATFAHAAAERCGACFDRSDALLDRDTRYLSVLGDHGNKPHSGQCPYGVGREYENAGGVMGLGALKIMALSKRSDGLGGELPSTTTRLKRTELM